MGCWVPHQPRCRVGSYRLGLGTDLGWPPPVRRPPYRKYRPARTGARALARGPALGPARAARPARTARPEDACAASARDNAVSAIARFGPKCIGSSPALHRAAPRRPTQHRQPAVGAKRSTRGLRPDPSRLRKLRHNPSRGELGEAERALARLARVAPASCVSLGAFLTHAASRSCRPWAGRRLSGGLLAVGTALHARVLALQREGPRSAPPERPVRRGPPVRRTHARRAPEITLSQR